MHVPLIIALVLAGPAIPSPAAVALVIPTLAVGATTSSTDTVGSGNTCAGFLDERTHLGALGIRRVFASAGQLPPNDALNCHNNNGAVLWFSFKTSCTPTAVGVHVVLNEYQSVAP